MTRESLSNAEWLRTVDRFGGNELLEKEAREFGAFERARKVKCAVDQLRLVLAYCWGTRGLRLTAAWAEAIGSPRCRTSRFSSGCVIQRTGSNNWSVA